MEQFSLEKYLKNPERKIITRNGKSVRIICTNRLDSRYPVVAFIRLGDDYEDIWDFTKEGRSSEGRNDDYDLFFAPIKKEGWINLYKSLASETGCISGISIFNTKEEALDKQVTGKGEHLGAYKIEWEE